LQKPPIIDVELELQIVLRAPVTIDEFTPQFMTLYDPAVIIEFSEKVHIDPPLPPIIDELQLFCATFPPPDIIEERLEFVMLLQ
jgi:hypothetical protein